MDESFVAFGSLLSVVGHRVLFTVNSRSPFLYIVCHISCVLTTYELSVVYCSLAGMYLCSVSFVAC